MFSHNVQWVTIRSHRWGFQPSLRAVGRVTSRRWGRVGLALAALASLTFTWGACFAAPTPHPEDDATVGGGGPLRQDAGGDAMQGDWGTALAPDGDVDAAVGGDAGLENQDAWVAGMDADGLADGDADGSDGAPQGDVEPGEDVQDEGDWVGDVGPAPDAPAADESGDEEGD